MSQTGGFYLGTPGNLGIFGGQQGGPQPVGPAFPTGDPNPIPISPDSGGGPGPAPPNYDFAPQTVSPTGPSQGFDPQFLQNLTTYIGGLFSRPQGNLSFNPLGNLSDVPSQQLGYGNAPLFGLPNTLLQDALNNSLFNGTTATQGGTGGGGIGGGAGGTPDPNNPNSQQNPKDLNGPWWNLFT